VAGWTACLTHTIPEPESLSTADSGVDFPANPGILRCFYLKNRTRPGAGRMANLNSAKKRLRSSAANREANQPVRTRVRTSRRAFLEAVESGDAAAGDRAFRTFCSCLDKAAKKGVIKKNTALRSKGRAAARLRAMAT
jgi:small subunit ribosomal protein S20